MEIERKFKIKSLPDLDKYEYRVIEQGYLCTDPVMRVRKEDDKYYMTYKGRGFLEREEYNLPLNESAFLHLLPKKSEDEFADEFNKVKYHYWDLFLNKLL